jgi:hypothetical protein
MKDESPQPLNARRRVDYYSAKEHYSTYSMFDMLTYI